MTAIALISTLIAGGSTGSLLTLICLNKAALKAEEEAHTAAVETLFESGVASEIIEHTYHGEH